MTHRVHNFSAGPGVLPLPVLEEAAAQLINHEPFGMSIMEMSHRSKGWVERQQGVERDLRTLMNLPDDYALIFVQGGASTQFATVPLNLMSGSQSADYIDTGTWSTKALQEINKIGRKGRAAASSQDTGFDRIPKTFDFDPQATYVHYTSNNTIYGTQWSAPPQCDRPLVCDASSDILSRPMVFDRHDLLYAGAQKNMGPAGVTMVLIKKDLLDRVPANVPTMLSYKTHAAKNSAYNTPPVWPIYMVGLVARWLLDQGGLQAIEVHNKAKAALLYNVIDGTDFYQGHAQRDSRSLMNVTFRLPTPELDARFITEAAAQGLMNLKGHRSVGGCRASIYNAQPMDSVQTLAQFMHHFAATAG